MNKTIFVTALFALFGLGLAQTGSDFLSNQDQNVEAFDLSFTEGFHLSITEGAEGFEGEWVGENGEGEGEFVSEEWMNEEGLLNEEGWLNEEWINIEGLNEEMVLVELEPVAWE